MSYAKRTTVSSDRTRNEIEQTLRRYKASGFAYGWQGSSAVIMFEAHGRRIRFNLPLPDPQARVFTHGARGPRSTDVAHKDWEQACRSRWRALALAIKAKLEAVEIGITTFEDEFLAHIVLPNGSRFGDWAQPQIARAYETGSMPPLLLGGPKP